MTDGCWRCALRRPYIRVIIVNRFADRVVDERIIAGGQERLHVSFKLKAFTRADVESKGQRCLYGCKGVNVTFCHRW